MKDIIDKMGKKSLIVMLGFLILIVVVLFGGAFFYNKFFYKKSYSEIEDIMLNASKSYFKDNKSKLPNEVNSTTTVPVSTLVKSSKMKSIDEYVRSDSVKCMGSVVVTNLGNENYRYTSNLECGDKYKTRYFIDYVKNTVSVANDGNGLYKVNNELVYRGDDVNNYVNIYSASTPNNKYRIVKITDDYVELIYDDKLDSFVWDNRYNSQSKEESGINDYTVSRIKKTLQDFYDGDVMFSSYAKNLMITHRVGIGKRGSNDSDKTGSLENTTYMDNQYVTLLPIYEFMNVSNDSECKTTISRSCQNYNYLSSYYSSWWTATADKDKSSKVYKISGNVYDKGGYVMISNASINAKPRFVIYTAKDTLYVSGDGSANNPYIIK